RSALPSSFFSPQWSEYKARPLLSSSAFLPSPPSSFSLRKSGQEVRLIFPLLSSMESTRDPSSPLLPSIPSSLSWNVNKEESHSVIASLRLFIPRALSSVRARKERREGIRLYSVLSIFYSTWQSSILHKISQVC
ncbi:hypothetical protein PRIPAC_89503, partial [Pristionchus pacificus]|uniref:Uncharacterized protein n=1 Tax=Pristionchus pacificus TaxID=54126 RepID=A0A2A6CW58_PRIPA